VYKADAKLLEREIPFAIPMGMGDKVDGFHECVLPPRDLLVTGCIIGLILA
jgi:hypothetical protein